MRHEADRQWLLAAAVCETMAHTYINEGVDFALSAFRPAGDWKGCWSRLDRLNPIVIVLYPPIETALARDATRTGRAHTGRQSIERAYSYPWDQWPEHDRAHVIDNSTMSVPQVVDYVEALVGR